MAPNPTFQAIISAVNQSGGAFRGARTDLAAVRSEADKTRNALASLERPGALSLVSAGARSLTGRFGELNGKIHETRGLMFELFPPLAALGALGSIGGIFALVDKVAGARSEFNATAASMGLTAAQLGQFNFAAAMAEVPVETMHGALLKMNTALGQAAVGKGKDAVAILQRLGFSMEQIRSGTLTASDVMPKLADSFSKTDSAAMKMYVTTKLLGRGSAPMIAMLNNGSAEMAKWNADLAKISFKMPPQMNQDLEDYDTAIDRLNVSAKGLVNSIAGGLAPVLKPVVDDMVDWITANREWVSVGIKDAVSEFATFVRAQDWKAIGGDIRYVSNGVVDVVKAMGGIKGIVDIALFYGLWRVGSFAARSLISVAAGIDAVIAAMPALAALTVPAWLSVLARLAGPAGIAAYVMKPSATNAGENKELADMRKALGLPEGSPGVPAPETPRQSPWAAPVAPPSFGVFTPQNVPPPAAQPTPSLLDLPFSFETPAARRRRIAAEAAARAASGPASVRLEAPTGPNPNEAAAPPPLLFPSPYALPGTPGAPGIPGAPGRRVTGAGTLPATPPPPESRLKITLEIPNLPPGTNVSTETVGDVMEPEVNVGRSNPLDGY